MRPLGAASLRCLMAQQIKRTGQVHPETLLTELGALAGFAVQMSIRKSVIERQKLDPDTILVEVATKNDEIYYFSDLMNWMLFENTEHPPYSVWSYVSAAVPPEHQRVAAGHSRYRQQRRARDRHQALRGAAASARAHAEQAAAGRARGALARHQGGVRGVAAAIRRNGPTTLPRRRNGRC